jgi:murein L,D-transpeptidase YafK
MRGSHVLKVFDHIAIGRRGAGAKRWSGDNITPLGVFRVGWMKLSKHYNFFIGLNYPNLEYAQKAYRERRIDGIAYWRIRHALESDHTPPQDTQLGGYIGIHGLGKGDPYVHANFNWTSGCIALNNQQIQDLAGWVQVGTRVEIR